MSPHSAVAQLQPIADDTMGNENSVVTPGEVDGIPADLITEGARRGANLFHSFQEFSIDEGRAAYFANPAGVENILGRVTGGGQSDILGRLGVLGEANLFLINPNGIVFGPNSSLDIGGSFVASTANAIAFGERGFFSATTPEAPSPLLTINPSAFFLNQIQTSPITVQSKTPVDPNSGTFGLSVGVGENLALLGGDINVEGGGLNASGGRIDLGSVEGGGAIGLNADGSFAFPAEVRRGYIVFTEGARADVRTPGSGGAIGITARRITLNGGSQLRAGILTSQGFQGNQAGDIGLDAAEQISMTQSSRIENEVAVGSLGNAGNVEITTPILEVLDGARLSASTRGQGDAGNVIITASDLVTFQGESGNGRASAAFSRIERSGDGAGGNIEITTPVLKILDGAFLSASTFGQGDAGNVIITASDRVVFQGERSNGSGSAAFSSVASSANGAGGNIEIAAPILEMLDGAFLSTSTFGQGNAGNVIITARDRVAFRGDRSNGSGGAAFSRVAGSGTGAGGNIEITTPVLEMLDGAQLKTSTFGQGDSGNVLITASDRVIFQGESGNGRVSEIFSGVEQSGTGAGGNIEITTPVLEVLDGVRLKTSTFGQGDSGNVIITASNHVLFQGESGNGRVSEIFSGVERGGDGDGGNIEITTPVLEMLDGTFLSASTFEQGDSGDVIITASDRVAFRGESRNGRGGGAFSEVASSGNGAGGDIEITTSVLEVLEGARLITSTNGRGDAGSVLITASDRVTFQGESGNGRVSAALSRIETNGDGAGGNIEITTPVLEVLNGGQLNADSLGRGDAGNVIITASDRVTFGGNTRDGRVSLVFSSVLGNEAGEGGNIEITAPVLEMLDGAALVASTWSKGDAGNVIITASDRVLLDGVSPNGVSSGIFSTTVSNAVGRGKDVIITTPQLQISNGAFISTRTTSTQPGGNILIEADQVSVIRGGRLINTTEGDGQAGDIIINADLIHLSGRAPTFPQRLEEFGAANERNGETGLFASTRLGSTGNGGGINLNIIDLVVSDYAQINAQSQGVGAAGDVKMQAQSTIVLDNHASINSDTRGGEGDIDLTARLLLLRDNSTITTNASGSATGGNIDIEVDFIVAAPNENSDIFANALEGSGGQITLTALGIFGLEFRTRAELQQLLGDDPNDLTPRNLPSNDVTAFSQANPNLDVGTVTFRTPDVDPSRGLVELPVDLTDASQLIAQTCPTGNTAASQANEFTITGRGGLPPTPSEAMNQPAIQVDLVTANAAEESFVSQHESTQYRLPLSTELPPTSTIVEAQGFLVAADGTVSLVAAAPAHAAPSLNRPIHCQ
ncbi:MAG: filamentous hemagglutinin N-terminal domain-containing protein [Leptolyngbyaceae cyanobacterium MO_188.B28]|nr:filamentous hemagglutinin N-terminal domain-containing protein [Leptolyngbyaceae cyanobacterium MO_188.B28]